MRVFRFLHPRNWSKLGDIYEKGQIEYVFQKPKILLSQISVLAFVLTVPHLFVDLYVNKDPTGAFLDFITLVFMVFVYIFNEKGYYVPARAVFFVFVNVIVFLFCNLLPIERGVYLLFFAFIALPFPMFAPDRKFLRAFIATPIVMLLVTMALNYDKLLIPQVGTLYFETFVINVIATATVIIFSFELLININEGSKSFLNDLIEKWNSKNMELEKANSELDRFVYSTSHELRSPLLSIQGLVNLALADASAKNKNEYFQMILQSVNRQDEFITEVLQYSRNTRLGVESQPFNVKDVVATVVAECQSLEYAGDVSFNVDVKDEMVKLDESRVSVIVKNLLSNAVKYHDKRKDSYVNVTTSSFNGSINLTIEDNGIGIEKEYQDKIYTMFFRATNQNTGSGLGLYIVKEMVDKLSGEIKFESEYGTGTKFEITLPIS